MENEVHCLQNRSNGSQSQNPQGQLSNANYTQTIYSFIRGKEGRLRDRKVHQAGDLPGN